MLTWSQASVTATPTAQSHAQRAEAAVLPAIVILLFFVHDHGGGLRLRWWVVGRLLLRRRVVAALWRHLESWLRRRVVGVLLGVAHRQACLEGSLTGDFSWRMRSLSRVANTRSSQHAAEPIGALLARQSGNSSSCFQSALAAPL